MFNWGLFGALCIQVCPSFHYPCKRTLLIERRLVRVVISDRPSRCEGDRLHRLSPRIRTDSNRHT